MLDVMRELVRKHGRPRAPLPRHRRNSAMPRCLPWQNSYALMPN